MGTKKVTVNLDSAYLEMIEFLKKRVDKHETTDRIIQRSLELSYFIEHEISQGSKLTFTKKDGSPLEV